MTLQLTVDVLGIKGRKRFFFCRCSKSLLGCLCVWPYDFVAEIFLGFFGFVRNLLMELLIFQMQTCLMA